MKNLGKKHIALIAVAVFILLGSIGLTAYLLLSNYQNVALFKQAKANFLLNTPESLKLAEAQLQQVVRNDDDNESAYIILGKIAEKNRVYPEQVYYCYMAHRLNPLSAENRAGYIRSLCLARYFDRLENFLSLQPTLDKTEEQLLLYAAGRNGSINKYKNISRQKHSPGDLAFLLFKSDGLTVAEKLEALKKFPAGNSFMQQEILVAQAELYLSVQDIENTEQTLKKAYELNEFAFAPFLGRFYANFRSFGKALAVFEKHLAFYHDPAIAIQTAEIYYLLNQSDKIEKLREHYQADAGKSGMLYCYYFDSLTALLKNNPAELKELTRPLRNGINTPIASFMFLCADLQEDDAAAVLASYTALLGHRTYMDFQKRADNMVSDYLKSSLSNANIRRNEAALLALAQKLYSRKPEIVTAKFMLLMQRRTDSINVSLLTDAMKRFPGDYGIAKIGIEYYLNRDAAESSRLLALYKKNFPARKSDIARYEIALALKKKDFDQVSKLFQKHFSAEFRQEYWNFASSTLRKADLLFLSNDKEYAPFSRALLLMKEGKVDQACDLLEKADAENNEALLFLAAKILAENRRNHAALKKYSLFPQDSSYKVIVLMNTAEIQAELGDLDQAVIFAGRAHNLDPQMPAAQLCYADKLYRKGNLTAIPDIIKISSSSPLRPQMEKLWIAGMQQRIKQSDINTQREKIRELCRQLLVVAPADSVALEYMKKISRTQH